MNPHRFVIVNRESLVLDQEMLPLAQHLMRILTTSGFVRRFSSSEPANSEDRWIVFRGDGGRGFGVRMEHGPSSLSTLQRALEYVRTVHTIVRSFGGARNFPFELSLESSPPAEWRAWRVNGLVGELWCAASLPVTALPVRGVDPQRDPSVRIRLVAVARGVESVGVGVRVEFVEVHVRLPEVGICGRGVCRGGEMTIEVQESGAVEEQHIPGVRLDLGEIEMRLSDLVGLRPGAVVNLGEVVLERCFIRLGATVLAEGRFASAEGKLVLTIDSVL